MGGSGSSVNFEQSPQQRWLWENFSQPYMQKLAGGNIDLPSMYDIPESPSPYQVPDISSMMPTGDWFGSLDPSIKAGIRSPYEDAGRQMLEIMGAKGQTGSVSSPYSGSAASATGKFWEEAARGMGQQGWNMISPALQQGWQAQLGSNIAGYGQDVNQWQTSLGRNMNEYQAQLASAMMPYQMLPGITQQSLPYPVVDPGDPGFFAEFLLPMMQLTAPFGASGAASAWSKQTPATVYPMGGGVPSSMLGMYGGTGGATGSAGTLLGVGSAGASVGSLPWYLL